MMMTHDNEVIDDDDDYDINDFDGKIIMLITKVLLL